MHTGYNGKIRRLALNLVKNLQTWCNKRLFRGVSSNPTETFHGLLWKEKRRAGGLVTMANSYSKVARVILKNFA